jgi:GPI-anchor transamidase subunit K
MLADGVACDPRNPLPGVIYSCSTRQNSYLDDIEVDYKGLEVTEESFRRVLTGKKHNVVSIFCLQLKTFFF